MINQPRLCLLPFCYFAIFQLKYNGYVIRVPIVFHYGCLQINCGTACKRFYHVTQYGKMLVLIASRSGEVNIVIY